MSSTEMDDFNSSRPHLTTLPVEIKIQILEQCSDISSLRSLVACCSSYHQAYLTAREAILSGVVHRQIDPWLEDLQLVIEARKLRMRKGMCADNANEEVAALLDRYRRGQLSVWTDNQPEIRFSPQTIPIDQIIALAHAQRFVDWTCQNMCRQYTERLREIAPLIARDYVIQPSRHEVIRLNRAICRYEAFCLIFPFQRNWYDAEDREDDDVKGFDLLIWDAYDVNDLYLRLFPPWEVEEMACIFDYLKNEYAGIFIDIARYYCGMYPELSILNSSYRDSNVDPFEPCDIRPTGDAFGRGREYEAMLGPAYLYQLNLTKSLLPILRHYEGNFYDRPDYVFIGSEFGDNLLNFLAFRESPWYIYPADEHVGLENWDTSSNLALRRPSRGWAWLNPSRCGPKDLSSESSAKDLVSSLDGARLSTSDFSNNNSSGMQDSRPTVTKADETRFTHTDSRNWGYVFWDSNRLDRFQTCEGKEPLKGLEPIADLRVNGRGGLEWSQLEESRWLAKATETDKPTGGWDLSIFRDYDSHGDHGIQKFLLDR